VDNPRLNNRLWDQKLSPEIKLSRQEIIIISEEQPRPIVLDTDLAHIRALGEDCRLKDPIVCCSVEAASSLESLPLTVQILPCKCTPNGKLDIEDVLHQLWSKCGIRSLMVEGGAAVLSCFLERDHRFDAICVTVAPKLLGASGIGPSFEGVPKELGADSRFFSLGNDAVLLASYPSR
jgi:riboflavin biosynthesis pyrimidine reductase